MSRPAARTRCARPTASARAACRWIAHGTSVLKVPITRLQLGDAEADAAARVVRSGWVTQGPEVSAFEMEFARAVGAPHAVAVSSCTVALELALRAAGVKPGDDVATVSHSFIA